MQDAHWKECLNSCHHISPQKVRLGYPFGFDDPFVLISLENNWDQAYKEYLWTFISRIADIQFLVVNNKKKEDVSRLCFPLTVTRVECGSYDKVKKRQKHEIAAIKLSDLQEEYGTRLRVIASEDKRLQACLGTADVRSVEFDI